MATPYYIANFEENSGLQKYFQPFLIPERAFPILQNCFCYRGRVERKRGYKLLGRLRRELTTAAMGNISAGGAGTFTFNIFTGLGVLAAEPNAELEPGVLTTITIAIGAPISQTLTDATGTGTMVVGGAGPITAASVNYATGVLSITFSGAAGASAATFSGAYYPTLPVMGLKQRTVSSLSLEQDIFFDTKYIYTYSGGQFDQIAGSPVWQATDIQFPYVANYFFTAAGNPIFWITNENVASTVTGPGPMYYFDGTTFTIFNPELDNPATEQMWGALLVVPYKNTLIFMNTWEGAAFPGTNQPNRIRWCGIFQDPTLQAGASSSWRSDIAGFGGFADLPTTEQIVACGIIKDTLIVKTETKSWKIVFTGNQDVPFEVQLINQELGAESTNSSIAFDRGLFTVGNYGVTTDDTVNVQRIDISIPNLVFSIANEGADDGPERVYVVRDYQKQLVYWLYPEGGTARIYPNKILVYNYVNQTWAIYNDSFTALGNIQSILADSPTWEEEERTWEEDDDTWGAATITAGFPFVGLGNAQGFVFRLDIEQISNDPSLTVRSYTGTTEPVVITSPNHGLEIGMVVELSGGIPTPLSGIWIVSEVTQDTFTLIQDSTYQTPTTLPAPGSYLGNAQVRKIDNFLIETKHFSIFYEKAKQCKILYVDFFVDTTPSGSFKADVAINETRVEFVNDPRTSTAMLGTNIVSTAAASSFIPGQFLQQKVWKRLHVNAICQNFFIQMSMGNESILSNETNGNDFALNAMTLYVTENARMIATV